jgi:dimethylargininase
MFSRAIVRQPGNSLINGITTAGLGAPDYELALKQHGQYIDALEQCGLEVTVMPADENYPDGLFIEDAALVMSGCAVSTRPGASERRGEVGKSYCPFTNKLKLLKRLAHWMLAIL